MRDQDGGLRRRIFEFEERLLLGVEAQTSASVPSWDRSSNKGATILFLARGQFAGSVAKLTARYSLESSSRINACCKGERTPVAAAGLLGASLMG
jgi:hypothetical protein